MVKYIDAARIDEFLSAGNVTSLSLDALAPRVVVDGAAESSRKISDTVKAAEERLQQDALAVALGQIWRDATIIHFNRAQWQRHQGQEWMQGSHRAKVACSKQSPGPVDQVYQVYVKQDGTDVLVLEAKLVGDSPYVTINPSDPMAVKAMLGLAVKAREHDPTIILDAGYHIRGKKPAKILFDECARLERTTGQKVRVIGKTQQIQQQIDEAYKQYHGEQEKPVERERRLQVEHRKKTTAQESSQQTRQATASLTPEPT